MILPPLENRILYACVMLVAVVGAYALVRKRQKRLRLSPYQKTAIGFAAFVGAMIGAKLPFVAQLGWHGFFNGATWIADGKTILGGIFGGYLAVEFAKWYTHVRISTGDSFALPIAVAVAHGRLGCFIVGCCFGAVTDLPWGIHFPLAGDEPDLLRHPTQLYESAFHFIAAGFLIVMDRRRWLVGQQLKAYLLAYLAYRFLSEWLRPEPKFALGLTIYQIASIGLTGMLSALWIRDSRRMNKNGSDAVPQSTSGRSA